MKKLKEIWCEVFSSHEWKEVAYTEISGVRYIIYECKKCGKRKREQDPVLLWTSYYQETCETGGRNGTPWTTIYS